MKPHILSYSNRLAILNGLYVQITNLKFRSIFPVEGFVRSPVLPCAKADVYRFLGMVKNPGTLFFSREFNAFSRLFLGCDKYIL